MSPLSSDSQDHLGPYKLTKKLGEGGMGSVHLGLHTVLDVYHAIKILPAKLAEDEQHRHRFLREARQSARLNHPHIVRVFSADDVDGKLYIAMEYIPSRSLEEVVRQDGPIEMFRAVRYVHNIAKALIYAHAQGVIHRDVKPANILLDETDSTKLTDFGLVRALDVQTDQSGLTLPGSVLGTPYYMPPEQWTNEGVDERSDVYALGAVLYYLIAGRVPFPGNQPFEVYRRIMQGPPEPIPGLDPQLHRLLERVIHQERKQRPDSAREFAEAIEQWWHEVAPAEIKHELLPVAKDRSTSTIRPSGTELRRPDLLGAGDEPPSPESGKSPPASKLPVDVRTKDLADGVPEPPPPPASLSPASAATMTDTFQNLAAEPVEIAPDTFWVGKRPPGLIFYANPYLRRFRGAPSGTGQVSEFNLIIDPGSASDFSIVRSKSEAIIGNLSKLSAIFINHQDPDVGSSAGVILGRYAPKARILCTEETWRLIQYYNIPRDQLVRVEKHTRGLKLPTGNTVIPVPSPFCHFVGAMMLYDPETRVLFTGDLFGSLTDAKAEGLYADESDWIGMRTFHQIYMPTNKAMRHAFANIRKLDPPVQLIAPQHGRIVRGEWIQEYMNRLEKLPVGLDILDEREVTPDEMQAWNTVLTRVISTARDMMGSEEVDRRISEDPDLHEDITKAGSQWSIKQLPRRAVEHTVRILIEGVGVAVANPIKYEAIAAAEELGLPSPEIDIEEGDD